MALIGRIPGNLLEKTASRGFGGNSSHPMICARRIDSFGKTGGFVHSRVP
jgi:hypothetical protein